MAEASTAVGRERFDNRTQFFLARWDQVRKLGTTGNSAAAERICQELLGYPELGTSSENLFLASLQGLRGILTEQVLPFELRRIFTLQMETTTSCKHPQISSEAVANQRLEITPKRL